MGKKPITHIKHPNQEGSAGGLRRGLCGVYYGADWSERWDNTNPSCQKCLRFRHSPRRLKERQQKNRRSVTKAR